MPEHVAHNNLFLVIGCLRADVSYFLCCPRATKEIGDVCTQAMPLGVTKTQTLDP